MLPGRPFEDPLNGSYETGTGANRRTGPTSPRRSLGKSLSIDAFTSSSRPITRRDEVRWGRPPPSHPTLLSVGDENGVQTP